MTAPLGLHTIDVPMFLDGDLLTADDDTFIPEQPEDIVAWLDKNDKDIVLSSDSIMSNKPDPLLNQVSIRDSPTLLHLSDTDPEQLGDILDTSESIYFTQNNSRIISKIDKNMNSLLRDKRISLSSIENKCDILEKLLKFDLSLEITEMNSKLQVILHNSFDNDLFPNHFILVTEAGHVNQSIAKQPIKLLEKTLLSPGLDIRMPCLHSKLGLRVWFCPLDDCRRAFYRYNLAKLHGLQHLDHKPFKCDFPNCEWAFYTSFKLRRHQETHSKRKDFVCSYAGCDRSFTTIYNLNWHRRRCHEKPATIPCNVKGCDKQFQTIRARELHMKLHGEEEAPYRCPVPDCGKPFFLYTGLSAHARVHSHKESELRCQWPNCGRMFEHPCRLKQHTLQHTGQRPFMCTYDKCKWAFSTASKLKRHLSTHTNERKFHCTMGSCSKSFLRSQHLKDHTLTHIGQRSFHCEECNANFAGKSVLYLHMKKAHPKSEKACARAVPYKQHESDKQMSDNLLEEAIQSLDVPSDMILGTSLLPDEPLELLENENFSTVNLRDLE
ncbi:hypothetical protein RN001_015647 [Aquatica leii]|uniref:C2H2-type domain-containing protein n=1 Tax=Aquatica leii TaxID=1421715 RepID=A0AAN7NZ94_9COLE|nr:hypothetical protein RN001_015647 [Aquatica leii]